MKKIISAAAVIVTLCLQNASAQTSAQVTPAVAESFSREFKDATNVKWTKIKGIYRSRFDNQQEYCLAYFDPNGQMILSGRKISLDIAPLAIKRGLEQIRDASERKHDLLAVAEVYELNDSQETKYFINLNSDALSMSVMVHGDGHSEIVKKVNNKKLEQTGTVIAGERH